MSLFTKLTASLLINLQKSKVEAFFDNVKLMRDQMRDEISELSRKVSPTLLLLKPLVKWIIENESERIIIIEGNPHYFKYLKSEKKISVSSYMYSYKTSENIDGKINESIKIIDKKTLDSHLAIQQLEGIKSELIEELLIEVPANLLTELENALFINYGNELNLIDYANKNFEFLNNQVEHIVEQFSSENYLPLNKELSGLILFFPSLWVLYYLRGRAFMSIDKNEEALLNFFMALEYSEDELEVLRCRFLIFYNMEAKNLAIKDLVKILVKEPNDPVYNITLGNLYFQENDYKNAIKYFSIAKNLNHELKLDKDLLTLESEAEYIYSFRMNFPEHFTKLHFVTIYSVILLFVTAIEDMVQLEELVQLFNSKEFSRELSQLLYHLISILGNDVIDSNLAQETSDYVKDFIIKLLKKDAQTEFITCILKEIQYYPENLRRSIVVDLIRLKRELLPNKSNEQLKILCRNFNIDYQLAENISIQESPVELFRQGLMAEEANNLLKAKELYKKVIELSPGFYKAYDNLADIYSEEGNHNESISCYLEALKLNYENSGLHNSLGCERLVVGEIDKAYINFKISLLIDPENMHASCNLGEVKMLRNNPKDAILILNSVIEKSDDEDLTSEALYYRGLAKSLLGNNEESKSDLEKATSLGFDSENDPILERMKKDTIANIYQSDFIKNNIAVNLSSSPSHGFEIQNNNKKNKLSASDEIKNIGSQNMSSNEPKYCSNCGAKLRENSKFCSNCGQNIL